MSKTLMTIFSTLIVASIIATASAIIKVEVIAVKVKAQKEILTEIKNDLKEVLKRLNVQEFYMQKKCKR